MKLYLKSTSYKKTTYKIPISRRPAILNIALDILESKCLLLTNVINSKTDTLHLSKIITCKLKDFKMAGLLEMGFL